MGRRFTRASSENVKFTNVAMAAWGYGTIAVVARLAATPGAGIFPTIVNCEAATDDSFAIYLDGGDNLWYGFSRDLDDVFNASQNFTTGDGWVLLAITKATGSVAPRMHKFIWTSGTWAHAASATSIPDQTATWAIVKVVVGTNRSGAAGTSYDGDIAASMWCPKWVATDSEIERLAAGSWDRYVDSVSPGFLCEFPSGRDVIALGGTRDQSRSRAAQLSIVGGSRTAAVDPPGFRFSRFERRR